MQGDAPLRPASSLKLLTAIAAVSGMGVEGRFETVFEYDQAAGNLVARAGGDPMFVEGSDGSLDSWLDDLAGQVLASGISNIPGALVLDEGGFAEPAPGPGWPTASQHWTEWCGLSGGFSANGGCITATVTPAQVGASATVRVRPRDNGLTRRGTVSTGARGSQNAVAVGANRSGLTVRGSLPAGSRPFVTRFSHPDPVELFGTAVVAGLGQRGVAIGSGFRQERGARGGPVVARLQSPILPLLPPILLESRNTIADQLLLATALQLGLDPNRSGGEQAIRAMLQGLGVSSVGLVAMDGSGLSRDDRVRPDQFTGALYAARGLQGWEHLLASLPVSGETGSLARRMRDAPLRGRVKAKTGFIGGTSALVGVAHTLHGPDLAFALIVNYPVVAGLNTSCWKPLGDEVAGILVSSEES